MQYVSDLNRVGDNPGSGDLKLYISQLEGLKKQMAEAQMTAERSESVDTGSLRLSQRISAKNSGQHAEWRDYSSSKSRRTASRKERLHRLLAIAHEREKQVLVRGMILYWRLRVSVSSTYQRLP